MLKWICRGGYVKNYLKLWKYMFPYTFYIIITWLFLFAEVNMQLLVPTISSNIIDIGLENGDLPYVLKMCIYMLGATLLNIIFGILTNIFSTISSTRSSQTIAKDLFKKVEHMDFEQIDQIELGNIITRLTNDTSRIRRVNKNIQLNVFKIPIDIVGSIIYAYNLSPRLSLILLIVTPLLFIINFFIIRKSFPYHRQVQEKLDKVNTVSQESISNIRIIKAFVKEDDEVDRFIGSIDELKNTSIKAEKISALSSPITSLLMNFGIVAIILLGGFETINGRFKVGEIFAFITYFRHLAGSLLSITNIMNMFARAEASSIRILEILHSEPHLKGNSVQKEMIGKIEFRNVTFAYKDGEPVLKNINLVINPCEKVGIIGKNGSGKTTLIHLIHRFYDVSEGEILIDDINIKAYNLENLREQISSVSQKTFLFAGTIEDNIKFGKPDATEEDLVKASEIAQASNFISDITENYQAELGERGINLSGGQKQRLSIARTIITSPKILIFDDCTSAVDMKTESNILNRLGELNCTSIIIGQRIKSMEFADKIVVLDEGRITGIGTSDELVQSNDIYREIYLSQMGSDNVE
ncbi:MAG: transporter related protein [Haloplasmataceae bacterium]|nr:transporter related protein [Haloplasmataceae bacterium]